MTHCNELAGGPGSVRATTAAVLLLVAGASGAQTLPPPPRSGEPAALESVVVTGSLLRRTDIETPSPVTVISAADIQQTGLTTISDVIRTLSADNSGTLPTSFGLAFAAGSSGVALRGLTVNSTLVLIDGRRAANYALADDGVRSFVDLNTIPIDSVERIEVLKDGASSIYGADAIAGVVNVILKSSYSGTESTVEVGTTQSGASSEHFTATAGTGDLQTDHYNAMVSIEYQHDDRLVFTRRPFPYNTNDLSSIGGLNLSDGQPALNQGSFAATVRPGTLSTPGNLLTGVPNPGAVTQLLSPCVAGQKQVVDPVQGTYCSWQQGVQATSDVDDQPAQKRIGLYSRVTAQVNDHLQAYLNAGYYQNEVVIDLAPYQIQTTTPTNTTSLALPPTLPTGALNPNDPFANATCAATPAGCPFALINYAFGPVPTYNVEKNHNLRVVAGLKGDIAGWDYDTALVVNHSWLATTWYGLISYKQLSSDVVNGTYNFVNPSANSAATLGALAAPASKTSTTDMDSIDFRLSRSIGNLPGGPIGLGLGVEARYEAQNDPNLNPANDLQALGVSQTIGSRAIFAAYAEFGLPILRQLEVNVSGRMDHYTDFGNSANPKIGVKWTPLNGLALRATYSRGFRAPSFAENGSSVSLGFITLTPQSQYASWAALHNNDAYTNPYGLGLLNQANAVIQPEKSQSGTFGVVIEPNRHANLSVDYYVIKKTNVIVPPNTATGLNQYFAGQPTPGYAITVDNPDPQAPNAPPRPLIVGAPYVNANTLQTDGIDVDLRLRFDLPAAIRYTSNIAATKILSWKMVFPGDMQQQYVGTEAPYILSSGAGTPRYRGSWDNTFAFGPASVTATARYVSGFKQTGVDATGSDTACLYGTNISNCRVASFTTLDLTGAYKLTDRLSASVAVLNATDRLPPLNPANYAGLNYNPTYHYAGVLGRFWRLGFNVKL
jgi:iron complex outermembrane receptor protein